MRMWKVNPRLMCRKHLLGEHVEMHMMVGVINRGKSVKGYLKDGLIEIDYIRIRHGELVKEMKRRGMKHKSPLMPFKVGCLPYHRGKVNSEENLRELSRRCPTCKQRIEQHDKTKTS